MKVSFSNITKYATSLLGYFKNMNDIERERISGYLHIILTLFTVSFFGVFAITPTLSTISNLNKQYADNKLVFEALNKKLSALQLLDLSYSQIQPDLEIIYAAVPRSSEIPKLTRQIENLAAASNVKLIRLNFGTIEIYPAQNPTSLIYSYTFTAGIAGRQNQVNNFISNMISFDRIIGMERVTTGQNEEKEFEANFVGKAYFSIK